MQIIAFAGLARAGKTTAAETLAAWAFEAGYDVRLERFAGPLKDAAALLGWDKDGPHDDMYRKFCQNTGAAARAYQENWWASLMEARLLTHSIEEGQKLNIQKGERQLIEDEAACLGISFPKNTELPFHERLVIFDDVRYMNEIEMLRKNGAVLIFICGSQRLKDLDAAWRQHESEKLAFDYTKGNLPDNLFDYSVSANTDLETYKRMIRSMGPHWTKQIASENIHEK